MKRLLLLRHAKSSWDDETLDDHERPLAPRGRTAATQMAAWLAAHDVHPQLVLCSTSTRTRQTLELVLPSLANPTVSFEDGLYHAGAEQLLERARAIPDVVGSAMLIGHNPGLHDFALTMASPGAARERLTPKLPTGALVMLASDVDRWADLVAGEATTEAFVTPREL